jgi:hypothetical protein
MSTFLLLDDGMQNVREMWFTKSHNNKKFDELLTYVDMQLAEKISVEIKPRRYSDSTKYYNASRSQIKYACKISQVFAGNNCGS